MEAKIKQLKKKLKSAQGVVPPSNTKEPASALSVEEEAPTKEEDSTGGGKISRSNSGDMEMDTIGIPASHSVENGSDDTPGMSNSFDSESRPEPRPLPRQKSDGSQGPAPMTVNGESASLSPHGQTSTGNKSALSQEGQVGQVKTNNTGQKPPSAPQGKKTGPGRGAPSGSGRGTQRNTSMPPRGNMARAGSTGSASLTKEQMKAPNVEIAQRNSTSVLPVTQAPSQPNSVGTNANGQERAHSTNDFDPLHMAGQKSHGGAGSQVAAAPSLSVMSSSPVFMMNHNAVAVPIVGLASGIDSSGNLMSFSTQQMMHMDGQNNATSPQEAHQQQSQQQLGQQFPTQGSLQQPMLFLPQQQFAGMQEQHHVMTIQSPAVMLQPDPSRQQFWNQQWQQPQHQEQAMDPQGQPNLFAPQNPAPIPQNTHVDKPSATHQVDPFDELVRRPTPNNQQQQNQSR